MPTNVTTQYMQRVDDTLAGEYEPRNGASHYRDAYVKMLAYSGLSKVSRVKRNHLFAFGPFQKNLKNLFTIVLAAGVLQQIID